MKPGAPSTRTELEAPKWSSLEATPLAQRGHNSAGAKSTRATEEKHTGKIFWSTIYLRYTGEKSSTDKLNRPDLAQYKKGKMSRTKKQVNNQIFIEY
jgi:hypothetical protein